MLFSWRWHKKISQALHWILIFIFMLITMYLKKKELDLKQAIMRKAKNDICLFHGANTDTFILQDKNVMNNEAS